MRSPKLQRIIAPMVVVLVAGCGAADKPRSEGEPTVVRIEQEGAAVAGMADATATTPYVAGEAARRRPDADVLHVRAVQESERLWRFEVTLAHPDKDADDYLDGWDVLSPDGQVLGREAEGRFTQAIAAPSVGRQPMERVRSDVSIAAELDHVIVRAHDSRAGFGGREVTVYLDQARGPGFEVSRSY